MDYLLVRCCSVLSVLFLIRDIGSSTVQNLGADEIFEFPPQLDVCDTEAFEAECPLHHVIFVRSALYGRMELGRCVEHAFGYVGCFRDVLSLADRRCSGRGACTIHVPNAEFENTRPCLKELKSFLRISYDCVKVENATKEKCEQSPWLVLRPQQPTLRESSFGFIASIVNAEASECSDKPWFIQAHAGQRINLTLFDFSLHGQHRPQTPSSIEFNHSHEDPRIPNLGRKVGAVIVSTSDSSRSCQEYAVVEDGEKKFKVCGGEGQRVAWAYLSVEHEVKIWVTAGMAQNDMRRFLVQYEVVGCPDPFLTDRVWFRKTGPNQATSGCIDSSQSWKLECFDQVWRPQVEQHPVNCSATTESNLTKRDLDHMDVESTTYFSLTVTAIFFILVALIVSLTCLIRHYRNLVAQEGKEEDMTKSKDSNEQQHLDLLLQQQSRDSQQHIQLIQTKFFNTPVVSRPNSGRTLCGQKFINEGISSVSFSVSSDQVTASLSPHFRLCNHSSMLRDLSRFEDEVSAPRDDFSAKIVSETRLNSCRSQPKTTTLF